MAVLHDVIEDTPVTANDLRQAGYSEKVIAAVLCVTHRKDEAYAEGEVWRPRFDFVSDKTWADLKPTDNSNVRHCETCSKNVHFCDNLADAREHSQEGHCIAVDLGIIRREGDLAPRAAFLGRPSKEAVRKTYEEDVDPVSQARLDARKRDRKKRARGQ